MSTTQAQPRLFHVTCTLGTEVYSQVVRADSKSQAIAEFRYFLLTGDFACHPLWPKAKFRAESRASA